MNRLVRLIEVCWIVWPFSRKCQPLASRPHPPKGFASQGKFARASWVERATVRGLIQLLCAWLMILCPAHACPLCEALEGTLRDDLKSASLSCIARVRSCEHTATDGVYAVLVERTSIGTDRINLRWVSPIQSNAASITSATSSPAVTLNPEIRVQSLQRFDVGQLVLMIGYSTECNRDQGDVVAAASVQEIESSEIVWVPPVSLSPNGVEYVSNLPVSEEVEVVRLKYYYDHLFSDDRWVSDDAYNECAQVSLASMRDPGFRAHIDLQEVRKRLVMDSTPSRYKSFLWMLLAECGEPSDCALFDAMAMPYLKRSSAEVAVREARIDTPSWLAAAMAAYVRLGGEAALQRLEDAVFHATEADPAILFAIIGSIRVLGDELEALPRNRLAETLVRVLDQPDSADFVISDLARWQHWQAIPKLSQLFDDAESSESFLRTPIINFMRRCPLPEAQSELARMQNLDPKSYRRALVLFPSLEPVNSDSVPNVK